MSILGLDPTDTDGNGATTPLDALRVINFLSRHGVTNVADLSTLASTAESELTDQQVETMRRLDTSGDGRITAVDALLVINHIARQLERPVAESESVDAVLRSGLDDADDDAESLAVAELF